MSSTADPGWYGRAVARVAALVLVAVLALLAGSVPQARAQETTILVVNVDDSLIRAGLALSKLGVAEVADQYTVAGTFVAARKTGIKGVVLKVLTSSGKTITRNAQFQGALLGAYGFLVFVPRQDGEIKMITLTR